MLRLVPEVRANIENMLLGVSEVRKEEIQSHAKNLSQLVFAVYDSKDSGDINQSIINDCQSIEKVNAQKKILFARAISSAYRANAWNSELLLALIIALFQGENSQNINVQNVERFLRVPLYLLTDVLNRRSPNGLDENNKVHRNFLVDFDLFCSVGTQVNNMPVYFITNESKLIASVTGHSPDIETHVMDLPSYLQLLRV
jgi:hypothetical protein